MNVDNRYIFYSSYLSRSLFEQYRLMIWCLVICSRDLLFMLEGPGSGSVAVG